MERFILTGEMEWYLAAGDAGRRERIDRSMDRLVDEDGRLNGFLAPEDTIALVYWFKETGNVKYEKAQAFKGEEIERTAETMPFYTAYDTVYHKKEHYSGIVQLFREITELTSEDLVFLADTIGQMSEEIYEHYKALGTLLQKNVRKRMAVSPGDMGGEERILIGYAALKGYNLGVLQNEAYLEFGSEIWKSTAGGGDDRGDGMMKKFQAQYLLSGK